MSHNKSNAFTFLVIFLFSIQIGLSQTTESVFVDVGIPGVESYPLCTELTQDMIGEEDEDEWVDCAFADGLSWGPYSFLAPSIPANMEVTGIEVVLHNAGCSSNLVINLEDEMLMVMVDKSCEIRSFECPTSDTRVSTSFDCGSGDTLGLIMGEINRFEVMADESGDAAVCFTHAEVIFTFDFCIPPVPVPTMGEWGLICLSLLLLIFGLTTIKQRVSVA